MSDIKILLGAEIDKNAVDHIYKQIENISKNTKAIKINIDIDSSALKTIEGINKTLTQRSPSLTPKIDISQVESGVSKITKHFKGMEEQASSMTKTTKDGFTTIKESIDLVNNAAIKTDVTDDFEKQRKSVEAIADAREKSAARVRMENEKLEQSQAKAINKTIDSNYKQQLSEEKINKTLQERIELYQKKMSGDMDIFSDKNKGKFDQEQLDGLRKRMEGLSVASGNAKREMKEISIEMGHMQKAASSSNSMLAQITSNLIKFARFYIVGQAVVNLKNSIQDGVGSVIELDASLTELAKVSDLSGESLSRFADRAYEVGKVIGRTGIEVVNATADFARMGFNIKDSLELAQEALLMVNVGDNISGIDDATSSIIAALKGFNISAEDSVEVAKRVNDMYNEVSNTMAVDTGSLANGVKRSSAVLHQAGVSMEETIGLLTGAYEVIQNMERSSVGLSTISQRLLGMDEDNNAIDGLSAKLESAFNDIGLTLMETNGQIKDTYTILGELASIYPELTKNQRAYIGELVSGKNRAPILQAVLSNWENVEKATESAMNSAGSAAKENEVYLESIAGKLKILESTSQTFFKNMIEGDTIKTLVTGATELFNVLDKLVNNPMSEFIVKVGLMTTAWLLLNKAWGIFNNTILYNNIGNIAINLMTATTSVGAFSAAVKAAGAAMLASPLFIPVVAATAILGIATAIDKFTTSLKEQKEIVNTLSSDISQLQSEYERLLSIENRTDAQNNQLATLKSELDIQNELLNVEQERLINQEFFNKKALSRKDGTFRDTGAEKAIKDVEDLINKQKQLANTDVKSKDWATLNESILKTRESLIGQLKTLDDAIASYEKLGKNAPQEFLDLAQAIRDVAVVESELEKQTKDTNNEFTGLSKTLEDLTKEFEDITSKIQTYNGFLSEMSTKEGLSAKSKQEIITKYQELLPYIDNEKELRKQLMAIIKQEEQTQLDAYKNMLMASEDFFNAKVKGNSELVNKLKEYYGVDLENAKNLAQAKELVETKLIKNLSEKWAKFYRVVGGNIETTPEYESLARGARMGNESAQKIFNEMHAERMKFENMSKSFDGLLNDTVFKGIGANLKDINLSGVKDPKKSKKEKDKYSAEADRYTQINLLLERNNILLARNKTLQDLAGDDIAKKIQLMDEQIKLEKEQQSLSHQKANIARVERAELEKLLSKQGFKFSGEGDNRIIANLDHIQGKTKEVEEQFNRYKDIQSKEIPSLQQSWMNLSKSIKDVGLNIVKLEFDLADQSVTKLKKSLSDLEYSFKLLEDTDLENKSQNIANQILNLEQQVASANKELEELNSKQFKEGSEEAVLYANRIEELTKRIQDGTLAIKAQEEAITAMREKKRTDYIAEQNKLYEEQQQRLQALDAMQEKLVAIIRKRGEEEKKALDEAHRAEMDSLDKRHKERTQKYKDEIDAFNKMIQDKIKALDEQYEEEDYLEQLNKEREEANRLQKDIDVLSLDDSLTARNKTIELRKQLADQNEKIAKMQQKKERDLLKKSLQDQLKDKEQDAKDKEDIANNSYENEKKRLEEDYKINKEFLDKKYSDDRVYAEAKESIMRGQVEVAEGVFMDIYDAFEDFEDKFGKGMGILGDIIKKDFIDQLEKAQQAIRDMEYLSQNIRPKYDSDRDFTDDEIGWKEPDRGSGSSSNGRNPNYGVGVATGQTAKDNEQRLREDAAYRNSEIKRAEDVIRDRLSAGLDVKAQEAYLKRLISGRYKSGGTTERTGLHVLDGEVGKPERVLSQQQTKSFDKFVYSDMPKLQEILKSFKGVDFQDIIKNAVLSRVNITTPSMPDTIPAQQGDVYHIDKIFDISGTVAKDIMPLIRKEANGIEETLKNLNKGGIFRPVKR